MNIQYFNLPQNWKWVACESVIDVRDGTHDTPKYQLSGIPLVTSKNLSNGDIDFENISYISKEDHLQISKRSKVDKGDIILAMIGTIGNPVLVSTEIDFSIKNVALFKFGKGNVDARYFRHLLDSDIIKIQLLATTRGGTQKFVSLKVLRNLQIPLPPLPEQQRIAAILDKADDMRAKRRAALAKLDTLLQATFIDMFGDPVTNPMGWEVGRIGDLASRVNYGTSKKAGEQGKFAIIRMGNITYEGGWNFSSLKYIDFDEDEQQKYLVQKGDILFNRTNSRELVGKTAVYREETPMAFAGYLVRLTTNEKADPEFVSAFMNTPRIKQYLQEKCKSIVGMANINAKEFQAIKIPIPPMALQDKYSLFVKKVLKLQENQSVSAKYQNNLFHALQQKAFTGYLTKDEV